MTKLRVAFRKFTNAPKKWRTHILLFFFLSLHEDKLSLCPSALPFYAPRNRIIRWAGWERCQRQLDFHIICRHTSQKKTRNRGPGCWITWSKIVQRMQKCDGVYSSDEYFLFPTQLQGTPSASCSILSPQFHVLHVDCNTSHETTFKQSLFLVLASAVNWHECYKIQKYGCAFSFALVWNLVATLAF